MVKPEVLVFDMDGVLVDVRASYRDCIIATVEHFTGKTITQEQIQQYKNRGGFNNDWLLSQTICGDYGVKLEYPDVVAKFNDLFFGTYMQREKWLPSDGLLTRLAERYPMYIFTGRLNEEAQMTLRRFAAVNHFAGVIGDDNVTRSKPHPDGLLQIQKLHPERPILYLGDTVDDAASASAAGVAFLGVGPHSGSTFVISDINELESYLA